MCKPQQSGNGEDASQKSKDDIVEEQESRIIKSSGDHHGKGASKEEWEEKNETGSKDKGEKAHGTDEDQIGDSKKEILVYIPTADEVEEMKQKYSTIFLTTEKERDLLGSKNTFPIPPDKLIRRAQYCLSPEGGSIGFNDGGESLADDFRFTAAFIEEGKEHYIEKINMIGFQNAFDVMPEYRNFYVDPNQTNRVWFNARNNYRHIDTFMGTKATGKVYELPPEQFHMDFDEKGLIKEFGFYTTDRRQGTTGGLGGVFGVMYAIGKRLPIREFRPYKPTWRFRFFNWLGENPRLRKKIVKKYDRKTRMQT